MDGKPPAASAQEKPARKGFVGKLATVCANHGHACLALIVVLTILVIGMYVYYHGLFGLGPRKKRPQMKAIRGSSGRRKPRSDEDDSDSSEGPPRRRESADLETERLIETINTE